MGPSAVTKKAAEALRSFAALIDSLCAFLDETEEERWHFVHRILKRQDYNSVCKIDEIEKAEISGDKKRADNYRFHALYRMIGYGVTGFCPDLEENRLKLKEKINEYISCLR